ncbi:hypothetical protein Q1695_013558 [Nippostrongylus brasiliensis]|nr:hypothetical protein Q1695_013558 [Nippostrongylus brasiliensis]
MFAIAFMAEDWCSTAPDEGRKTVCRQIHRMDRIARAMETAEFQPLQTVAPESTTYYNCKSIDCVCSFLNGTMQMERCALPGGELLGRALRKEYRELTDDERDRFHTAIWAIKRSGVYDDIARIHASVASTGSAHSGPAFLPWHREYLKRMELALRSVDATVAIPYWDSTLDSRIPVPKHSVLWSAELMGGGYQRGEVLDGAFAGWRLENGKRVIKRHVGRLGRPMSDVDVDAALETTDIHDMLGFTAAKKACPKDRSWKILEYIHGNPHIFVGEDMISTGVSANDPLFFLHHSFVDLVWEGWRQRHQTREQREQQYPADNPACSSGAHFVRAPMTPFLGYTNVDGLSNHYTDNLYSFSERLTCSLENQDCRSKYIFCDLSHDKPRCATKISTAGNCTGFVKGEDCCYRGRCVGGVCVSGEDATPTSFATVGTTTTLTNPTTTEAAASTTPTPSMPQNATWIMTTTVSAIIDNCFNEHECCTMWAVTGQCTLNPSYMLTSCRASCGSCVPGYDLKAECLDRHPQCPSTPRECSQREEWMKENCRKSCGLCTRTREEACTATRATTITPPTTTALPKPPTTTLPNPTVTRPSLQGIFVI